MSGQLLAAGEPASLHRAAAALADGAVVAVPTDTVYGLAVDPSQPEAVARLFALKGRPDDVPLPVLVAGPEQVALVAGTLGPAAAELAARFWPGPLTLVVPRSSLIPDLVTAGGSTVGLRVPASPVALALIRGLGSPIAAPSANRSNHLSPTRAEHVVADLDGLIDLVIDSGPTAIGLESTVLDLTTTPYRILRPGPIMVQDLETILGPGEVIQEALAGTAGILKSPGSLAVHYAPRAPAFRASTRAEVVRSLGLEGVVVVAIGGHAGVDQSRSPRYILESPDVASRGLYDLMRRCDLMKPRAIVVLMPPDEPRWSAVRDRLARATRPLAEWPGVGD